MSLKDPKQIHEEFSKVLEKLSSAQQPMSAAEQRKLVDDMSDIFNYVSAQSQRNNLTNVLHSQSAHDAKLRKLQEQDIQQLTLHRSFVESCFEKANQYLKIIQIAGYATFFGLWSFTRSWLPTHIEILTVLLLTFSAFIFIGWEIFKATFLSIAIRKHAKIAGLTNITNIELFIKKRVKRLQDKSSAILWFARLRLWIWIICLVPAVVSISLLLFYFCTSLLKSWPH
jgi:hypothetical protein